MNSIFAVRTCKESDRPTLELAQRALALLTELDAVIGRRVGRVACRKFTRNLSLLVIHGLVLTEIACGCRAALDARALPDSRG